jgi:hypothetical protein
MQPVAVAVSIVTLALDHQEAPVTVASAVAVTAARAMAP